MQVECQIEGAFGAIVTLDCLNDVNPVAIDAGSDKPRYDRVSYIILRRKDDHVAGVRICDAPRPFTAR